MIVAGTAGVPGPAAGHPASDHEPPGAGPFVESYRGGPIEGPGDPDGPVGPFPNTFQSTFLSDLCVEGPLGDQFDCANYGGGAAWDACDSQAHWLQGGDPFNDLTCSWPRDQLTGDMTDATVPSDYPYDRFSVSISPTTPTAFGVPGFVATDSNDKDSVHGEGHGADASNDGDCQAFEQTVPVPVVGGTTLVNETTPAGHVNVTAPEGVTVNPMSITNACNDTAPGPKEIEHEFCTTATGLMRPGADINGGFTHGTGDGVIQQKLSDEDVDTHHLGPDPALYDPPTSHADDGRHADPAFFDDPSKTHPHDVRLKHPGVDSLAVFLRGAVHGASGACSNSGIVNSFHGTISVTLDGGGDGGGPEPVCHPSRIVVDGAPGRNGADHTAPAILRLRPGENRVMVSETIDGPPFTVHDDADSEHLWKIHPRMAGTHEITYTAQTECPSSFQGETETLSVTFTVWSPGFVDTPVFPGGSVLYRCDEFSDGNDHPPVDEDGNMRWVVGYHTYPTGLSTGDRIYANATVVHTDPTLRFVAAEFPARNLSRFLQEATADPNLRYCQVDPGGRLQFTPDDPLFPQQYGMRQVRADDAWDTTLGDTTRTVCVVDTGVDYNHEDLQGSRWLGGFDFVNADSDPMDDHGHGTHVTGIAAATTDNAKGVAGLAQAGIFGVKTVNQNGGGPTGIVQSWTASGIRWCVDHGGHVVSVSLGWPFEPKAIVDAVNYAWNQDALVVAAAGNDGGNDIDWPAAHPKTVAVTCTDQRELQCSFSDFGSEASLAAPGHEILSTCSAGLPMCDAPTAPCTDGTRRYCSVSGTSQSAPHVSGAAALVWSQDTSLTMREVFWTLLFSADDKGASGWDPVYGEGLLDVRTALDASPSRCDGIITASGVGNFTVGSVSMSGPIVGASSIVVNHSKAAHPVDVWVETEWGDTVQPIKTRFHDRWVIPRVSFTPTDVTVHAELLCGKVISRTYTQIN